MDQLSNKGKRVREEDEYSSDSDITYVSDDEEMELAIHAYDAAFLPIVKKDVGLEKPDLVGDRTEMSCRVCPTGAPKLTGWKGLLEHAQTYKKKLPYKHRAYARALEQVFKENKPDPRAPPDAVRIVQSKLEDENKETFHRLVKRSKQEHEHQRALFEAQQLEMNQIQEQVAELEARKQQLSSRIQEMEMELEERRIRAQQQEAYYAEEKQLQAARFQQEYQRVDAANTAREEALKMALEKNEKAEAQERLFLLQELRYLSTVLSQMTIKEAEVLEREEAASRKRKRYERYMHEAIAAFNKKARRRGEESHGGTQKRREEERAAIKEKLLDSKKATECEICMSVLTSENRAILRPCGHAWTCMGCADTLWKSKDKKKKLCPFCRTKLEDIPILAPKELYL